MPRREDFGRVWAGVDKAWELGFEVKVKAVEAKNVCETDVEPLARSGREGGEELLYIELMPSLALGWWAESK